MKSLSSLEEARRVLRVEAQAILNLIETIGSNFEKAVDILLQCKGKVVVSGMGKSGQICRKIAATLASTGTPAFFLHPAEGIHGDLGMLAKEDAIIAISYSGETAELLQIIPLMKRLGLPIVALTGNPISTLAKVSDVVLDLSVREEACPMGLAPTASTTATLALGDALAVALLQKRGFKEEDFALLHPGGSLGRKLLFKVKDLMKTKSAVPLIRSSSDMRQALVEITSKHLGVTGVMNEEGKLIGIITDGDLRRHLKKENDFFNQKPTEMMTKNPKTIHEEELASKAMHLMEKHSITSLFITDESAYPIGIIHLHDLIKAGLA
ncbi:MAG: D-arabinose 5-phosphate isomerase [Deltaproteobacteria bacterium GWA2_38_16]|nr:MAG: D-arabinose 5-phosphate isomerase [Deltaproteobacteria bacterium GWA2_38_16]OGQ03503.1 MAG: D-arabinose 5-phosphate isomerase [Deltaproteobacteria bacterium RIFCSPHIGHO2_02_FULL_38_15]OGQ30383.1 MAG: D-arabinose 5-phosphate isomerase [Deltaproteobacteria bacterium RIFCSPLOWO2_01_FULL_38_9]OGQ60102.1 MAG: D-arabinose 5-phosphate isomerase [Deltaproteobacteria bacterium RIFCSPLOWO2_12_FULL_38_8]HBQ21262.1 D-arabinose 5-phosphate isomerase [Deltaproteobacteria bacterium]